MGLFHSGAGVEGLVGAGVQPCVPSTGGVRSAGPGRASALGL